MRRNKTRMGFAFGILILLLLSSGATADALEVGDKAPGFTLPATTGDKISLSQFRGKKLVLLEFYVNDFGAT